MVEAGQQGSLRRKILLAILGAGGMVVGTGLLSFYVGAKRALLATMGDSYQAHAREAARSVQLLLERELEEARMLAETDWALTAVRGGRPSREAERRLLDRLRRYPDEYQGFWLTDASGRLVAATATAGNPDARQTPWWQAARQGKRYVGALTGPNASNPMRVTLAVPLLDRDGSVAGVLRVDLKGRLLVQSIVSVVIGKTGHATLVNPTGDVLACPRYPPFTHRISPSLLERVTGPTGWAVVEDDGHGERHNLVGFHPVALTTAPPPGVVAAQPWYVFVRQSRAESLAPFQALVGKLGLLGAALLAGLMALGVLAARLLTRPLQQLTEEVNRISQGEFSTRVHLKTRDEAAALADAVNRMAETLEGQLAGLRASQEKFRQSLEQAQDAIFAIHPDTLDILEVNRAAETLTGYSRKELLGMKVHQLHPPSETSQVCALCTSLGQTGQGYTAEMTFLRKDGTRIPVSVSAGLIQVGEERFIQRICRDISAQKQAAEELAQRHQEIHTLYTVAQAASQSLEVEPLLKETLAKVCQLFQADSGCIFLVERGGLRPRSCWESEPREGGHAACLGKQPEGQRLAQRVAEVEEAMVLSDLAHNPLVRDSRSVREAGVVGFAGAPVQAQGRVLGVLALFFRQRRSLGIRDAELLTAVGHQVGMALEHARLYEDLAQHLKTLQETQSQLFHAEKMASLGQMVSGVAHELNNPLTGILGFAQLIHRREDLPEEIRRWSQRIFLEAQRASRVVDQLLRFARKAPPERRPVSLNRILEEVLALRAHEHHLLGVRVETRLDPDLPQSAMDAHQIQQVFLNLVLNAEQAMAHVQGAKVLTLATGFEGDRLWAEVRDTGEGIPPENLGKIFDPFFTTKEVGKGTGLGLSVAYGIVQEHGGRITVQSRPGEGAVFRVELPRIKAEAVPSVPAEPTEPRSSRDRLWLLVVDDEPAVRELAKNLGEELGYTVLASANGEEALDQLRAARFDLVLADLKMPGMDGQELYRRAVSMMPWLSRRFVFITGDTASQETERFLKQTGCVFLPKPFTLQELSRAMDEALAYLAGS